MSADNVFFWANWVLVGALIIGVVSTYAIVVSGNIKEAALRREVAAAGAVAETAKANAATANLEATRLRLELDREIQKRAPRFLADDQKTAMFDELSGKISEIAIVVQNDPEAQAFALQFFILFQDARAKVYAPEAPREDRWFAPAGLMMYSPLGANEDQLKDDPLYRALKRANLFGGTMGKPFVSGQPRGPTPALIQGYDGRVLYIGQKSPF